MNPNNIESLQGHLQALLAGLKQEHAGGAHTSPEARLFLLALALMIQADGIIETGYDMGVTTKALALSGTRVRATDNLKEYGGVKVHAAWLNDLEPVELFDLEALDFLRQRCLPNSYDLVFIDDYHEADHLAKEIVEVRRILRPGGVAVFHDTDYCGLWATVEASLPDWHKINLSCYNFSSILMGLGLAVKPRTESEE